MVVKLDTVAVDHSSEESSVGKKVNEIVSKGTLRKWKPEFGGEYYLDGGIIPAEKSREAAEIAIKLGYELEDTVEYITTIRPKQ